MKANERMGRAMQACRITHGLTQDALAKKLGMTRANIANMESGNIGIMWEHVATLDKHYNGGLLRAWKALVRS